MTTETENMLYGPLEMLRNMLIESTAFQSFCGAEVTGTDEARQLATEHIHVPVIFGEDVESARPFCQADYGDGLMWSRASSTSLDASGSIIVVFEANISDEHDNYNSVSDHIAAHKSFSLAIGNIVEYLAGFNGVGLYISQIEMEQPPMRCDDAEAGHFFQCQLRLHWSPRGEGY